MPQQPRTDARGRFRAVLIVGLGLAATIGAAVAQPVCGEARGKLAEATALREQAREEAAVGSRQRVCDTLDEAADRTEDARDILEDCGQAASAIDLRTDLRDLRQLKRFNSCG